MLASRPGTKTLLVVAAFAMFAAACSAGGAATIDRAAPAKRPAAHRAGGVSSHLALRSHTLASGGSERGTLVISNKTHRVIPWSCGYFQVQLVNAKHPLEVHPTPCSLEGKVLRPGTTRLPFTLSATEVVCQGSCPALPPGTYHTKLFAGPDVIHPGPLTVRVVGRAKHAK